MLVFKFGGASVKDANAVKNLRHIIESYNDNIVIVVSAMGKMTNAFEKLCHSYYNGNECVNFDFKSIYDYHYNIVNELFFDNSFLIKEKIESLFNEIKTILSNTCDENYAFVYDQLVPYGELLSTTIISNYLNLCEKDCQYIDIRKCIITDNQYQEAKVDWVKSTDNIKKTFSFSKTSLYITQGFIGGTIEEETTTLGREGSDYSAAIIANILNAKELVIWKDVSGLLNADPKWFDDTIKLGNISYHEAIELSYYGATIIHPKTIKPLENKLIPLYVKSFIEPTEEGSLINKNTTKDEKIPSFIFKVNQVLISISPKDFSFIIEENLSEIFKKLVEKGIKINLMQNSALNFSICVDDNPSKIENFINSLKDNYKVLFNKGLELATIRHYNEPTINRVLKGKTIYLEQKTRYTAQFVISN